MNNFKVAIIIPDRGDRPEFLKNCLRMMDSQFRKPDHIELVDFDAINDDCDITLRYRTGYQNLMGKGFDCIFFIENDDWYAPTYIEYMLHEWFRYGKPHLFGTNETIYYNLLLKKHLLMVHIRRASAMNTMILPDIELDWGNDINPYTDSWLWATVAKRMKWRRISIKPTEMISIGIKHGQGMVGGQLHTNKLERYDHDDQNLDFLREAMDPESFEFYSKMADKLN